MIDEPLEGAVTTSSGLALGGGLQEGELEYNVDGRVSPMEIFEVFFPWISVNDDLVDTIAIPIGLPFSKHIVILLVFLTATVRRESVSKVTKSSLNCTVP